MCVWGCIKHMIKWPGPKAHLSKYTIIMLWHSPSQLSDTRLFLRCWKRSSHGQLRSPSAISNRAFPPAQLTSCTELHSAFDKQAQNVNAPKYSCNSPGSLMPSAHTWQHIDSTSPAMQTSMERNPLGRHFSSLLTDRVTIEYFSPSNVTDS